MLRSYRSILDGVRYLHEHDIVHCDLKFVPFFSYQRYHLTMLQT